MSMQLSIGKTLTLIFLAGLLLYGCSRKSGDKIMFPSPAKAGNPSPADASTDASINTDLTWNTAAMADSYDVYFGTVESSVTNATSASPEFKGNQTGTAYTPGALAYSTTYYWRLDSKNTYGTAKGDVWSFTTRAQPSADAWTRTWGGSNGDYLLGIAFDSSGNVYSAGITFSFGTGGLDTLALMHNELGELQWVKTWGGNGGEELFDVAVSESGIMYCAGSSGSFGAGSTDGLILEYNSSGVLQNAVTWGGGNGDRFSGVALDNDGNIYCAGYTVSFGAGGSDALLVKFNNSNELQWAKTWGGGNHDEISGVAVDLNGDIYCAGWTYTYGAGDRDALLLKYNSSGALQWAKTWGGGEWDEVYGVAVDSNNNVYCAGTTYGFGATSCDSLLLKFDGTGVLQWARTWHGSGHDETGGVAVNSDGHVYCAGNAQGGGFGPGGDDALVLKYDGSGTLLWAKIWGGDSGDNAYGVAVRAGGSQLGLCGETQSYTGSWQDITSGIGANPTGTQGSPAGLESSPSGTTGVASGTENSPTGSESGAGDSDALIQITGQ
ncbi:MAG: hypothetical protein E3J72_07375 [Planctomycetota bacterium]|nr:MAG: hypothetical protein E3J72_07375 [Planctomycetota bacterium]